MEGFEGPEKQGVCCQTVSSGNVDSYTHTVSPAWLPKHELNKDKDRHGKVNEDRDHKVSILYKEWQAAKESIEWEK